MQEDRIDEAQPSELETAPKTGAGMREDMSLEDRIEALKAEVSESNKDKHQYWDMLQRVQADFINYKRRVEEEREEQQKYANGRLILRILPVLDEFNLAFEHASGSDAGVSWLEGVKLIHRKIVAFLESENVSKMEVGGREFDPSEHEAVGHQESADHQEGEIMGVARDGYKMHDRIIRPALVILAKKPELAGEEGSPSKEKETEDA